MPLAEYTIEFEELIYCLQKYEIKLPPVVVHINISTVQTLKKSNIPLLGTPYQTIPMTIWYKSKQFLVRVNKSNQKRK